MRDDIIANPMAKSTNSCIRNEAKCNVDYEIENSGCSSVRRPPNFTSDDDHDKNKEDRVGVDLRLNKRTSIGEISVNSSFNQEPLEEKKEARNNYICS